MARTPRQQRDLERARRAGATALAEGRSAPDAAMAQIAAAFGAASVVNGRQMRIERFIRLGPHHAETRARFGARAERLSDRTLDAAIIVVEHWWREERKAFQIASALGRGTRLSVDVLSELRILLRLIRRKGMAAEFPVLLEALRGEPLAFAAE